LFEDLFDLFERDKRHKSGERRRGIGGLLDRISGENRSDQHSDQRRTRDWDDDDDDDRYEGRHRRRRESFWDD
jgi:hypothetical protein